jgi:Tfp pilus assembly protein PilF
MIYAKTSQLEEARKYFRLSIESNTFGAKRKTDTLIKIALTYEKEEKYDLASKEYCQALIDDTNNFKIY